MAQPSTLYRFNIDLSDVTRGVYERVILRVAMHPSEASPFLITRVIAYCLSLTEGIEFTQGIGNPDDPAVWVKDRTGTMLLWIDVGNPAAKRMHKAAKAAKNVAIYTYRDPEILLKEAEGHEIHRKQEIEFYAIPPKFLDGIAEHLQRDNPWSLLRDEDELSITVRDEHSFTCTLTKHQLR